MMVSLIGATPKIDWESGDLPGTWNKFQTRRKMQLSYDLRRRERQGCVQYMAYHERGEKETYYNKFQENFQPKSNKVFSRYKFQCRVQQENETCEQFFTALKV